MRADQPTVPWILYIMVMFKRYGQLLLKMPSLLKKVSLHRFPLELSSFIILFVSFLTLFFASHPSPTKLNVFKSKLLHVDAVRFIVALLLQIKSSARTFQKGRNLKPRYASPTIVTFFEILRRSELPTWKSTRATPASKNRSDLRKGEMEICPVALALVYTTCLQRVRALPRRRAFVTALRNACEGDKETYEGARARSGRVGRS